MHNISSHHHHQHQVASNSPAAGAGRFIGGGSSGGGAGSGSTGESWQPNYKKDKNFDYGNTADVNPALSEVFLNLFFFLNHFFKKQVDKFSCVDFNILEKTCLKFFFFKLNWFDNSLKPKKNLFTNLKYYISVKLFFQLFKIKMDSSSIHYIVKDK